jgi:hypothetical protein
MVIMVRTQSQLIRGARANHRRSQPMAIDLQRLNQHRSPHPSLHRVRRRQHGQQILTILMMIFRSDRMLL